VECRIIVDNARLRAVERKRNRGSFEKLAKCTGWNPRITLTESLRDVLAYWELKFRHG